jgi:hypothetical protein
MKQLKDFPCFLLRSLLTVSDLLVSRILYIYMGFFRHVCHYRPGFTWISGLLSKIGEISSKSSRGALGG